MSVELCHYAKFRSDRSNRCRDIAIFYFFQDGGRRHLGFVMCVCWDHTQKAFGGLYHCVKFG